MIEGESKDAETCQTQTCQPEESLSPMDFSTFVLSLASSAMIHLGIVEEEAQRGESGSKQAVDLIAAKQLIDIIGVLENKTRGNLTDSEEPLLKSLLYDLRVHYCDAKAR